MSPQFVDEEVGVPSYTNRKTRDGQCGPMGTELATLVYRALIPLRGSYRLLCGRHCAERIHREDTFPALTSIYKPGDLVRPKGMGGAGDPFIHFLDPANAKQRGDLGRSSAAPFVFFSPSQELRPKGGRFFFFRNF